MAQQYFDASDSVRLIKGESSSFFLTITRVLHPRANGISRSADVALCHHAMARYESCLPDARLNPGDCRGDVTSPLTRYFPAAGAAGAVRQMPDVADERRRRWPGPLVRLRVAWHAPCAGYIRRAGGNVRRFSVSRPRVSRPRVTRLKAARFCLQSFSIPSITRQSLVIGPERFQRPGSTARGEIVRAR